MGTSTDVFINLMLPDRNLNHRENTHSLNIYESGGMQKRSIRNL